MLFAQVASRDYLVLTKTIVTYQGALAVMLSRVEFYPSYRQIRVGSSQTGTPNQTILFLGTYGDNDLSIQSCTHQSDLHISSSAHPAEVGVASISCLS